jgi:hypothetical protein
MKSNFNISNSKGRYLTWSWQNSIQLPALKLVWTKISINLTPLSVSWSPRCPKSCIQSECWMPRKFCCVQSHTTTVIRTSYLKTSVFISYYCKYSNWWLFWVIVYMPENCAMGTVLFLNPYLYFWNWLYSIIFVRRLRTIKQLTLNKI